MNSQFSTDNNKGKVNFYKHQHPFIMNDKDFNSSIYSYKSHHDQVPLNFIGRKTLHPPTDDSMVFNPAPFDGAWRAEEHIPIMRTMPLRPKFS
jgi:hypothetical protein